MNVPLGSNFLFIRNGMNVRQDKSGNGLPVTRIETISESLVDPKRVGYAGLTEDMARHWLLQPGDILFSHINSVEHIGKCAVYHGNPPQLVHGMNLLCLRSDQHKLLPEFAKYLLRSRAFRSRLANSVKRAVNQASVSIGDLQAIPVSVPSLSEQRRIAEILDKADALRANRRVAIAQLDTLVQSIFLDMFGDPAMNPKAWPVSIVGNVADVQGGLQVTSERKHLPRAIPYLRVANVHRGFLDLTEIKSIRATDAEIARTKLEKNDLLVVEGHGNPTEIGRGALWDGSISQCVHQNHIIRARFDTGRILPKYACEYLNSPGGRRHLLRAGKTTSGLNTISVSEVRGTPVAVPPIELQRDFASRLDAITKHRKINLASIAASDFLFSSLQHRAFHGEL